MTTDPVCGMKVDETKAVARAEYQGHTFYFCSSGCQKAFVQQPAKYAQAGGAPVPHGGSRPR
jgi:Cu+-exporting ATPase